MLQRHALHRRERHRQRMDHQPELLCTSRWFRSAARQLTRNSCSHVRKAKAFRERSFDCRGSQLLVFPTNIEIILSLHSPPVKEMEQVARSKEKTFFFHPVFMATRHFPQDPAWYHGCTVCVLSKEKKFLAFCSGKRVFLFSSGSFVSSHSRRNVRVHDHRPRQ